MVILGLGSNCSDRLTYLQAAVHRLSSVVQKLRLSRVLESKALLPPDAPLHWNRPYMNMAVSGITDLAPPALFAEIKVMERELGRLERGKWAPREIDIDILAMDAQVMESPQLTIPHQELLNRDFALLPLIDVAPTWHYPAAGQYCGWLAADIAAAKGFTLGQHLYDTGLKIHA